MADPATRAVHSVRLRITLAAVLVTAVAVAGVGWMITTSFEDAQIDDVRNTADGYLDELAGRLASGQDPQVALETRGEVAPPGPVRIVDEDGEVVASSMVPPPEGGEGGEGGGEVRERVAGGDDGEDRPDAPFPPGGDEYVLAASGTVTRAVDTPSGRLTVAIVTPVEQVARNVEFLTRRLVVGLPVLVALVGVLAWVVVGRALRPVESIRAEVERITGSTMHRRVPEPPTGDEIGRLARTMNTMLARLEASALEQRRFVSDASHELRSPVAVLRAGLEVARERAGPAGWATMVDHLLAEESRLEALLDDLLLLAAHDEGGPSSRPARPVDLAALARAEARRPRRVPVALDAPAVAPTTATGSPDQLARALGNLVDNAARHAAGAVRIGLAHDAGAREARLVVDDDGPGIPLPDRERVFERFTRLDDGRARHDGGSGLGLAVVRSIVTAHHGTVHATHSPLGGARFVVTLPAAAP